MTPTNGRTTSPARSGTRSPAAASGWSADASTPPSAWPTALDSAGRPRAAYSLLPAVPGSLAEQLWQQTWLLQHDERRFLRFALATQSEEGGERVR